MMNDLRRVASQLERLALFAVMVALPPLLAWVDVRWLGNGVGEWSLVELSQEGFLAASVLAFVRLARKRADERRFAVLAAAFFACMLLRELDALLDQLVHGLWKYPVAVVSASALAYALRAPRATLAGLLRLLGSRPGTLMMVGMVLLLCYARLIGMTGLWTGLMGEGYLRVVKNAIEETSELLAYTFILAGSVGYVAQRLRDPAPQAVAVENQVQAA